MNRLQKHFHSLAPKYQEEATSTFTHRGKTYLLNPLLALAEKKPLQRIEVKDLQWVLEYDTPDATRKMAADLNAPILVVYEPEQRAEQYTVVDGLHRLGKAVDKKVKALPAKVLTMEDLADFEQAA
jgi:hypothetical protein